jgi:hypothetical protein
MWGSHSKGNQVSGVSSRGPRAFARTRWAVAGLVVGVIGSSLARTGLPKPEPANADTGTAARTVGSIDGTVRSVTRGVQEVSASVRGQFDRPSSEDQSLKERVETSLLRDETLNADEIDVTVEDGGVVVLKGEVTTAEAKELAVGLTRELRGVGSVEDHLAVTPKTRVFSTPADHGRGSPVARQVGDADSGANASPFRRTNR